MEREDRGTGRTTRQMRDAPQGAVFVWPVWGSMGYASDLARHLGAARPHYHNAVNAQKIMGWSVSRRRGRSCRAVYENGVCRVSAG